MLILASWVSIAPVHAQEAVRAPTGSDPYQTYTEAAAHFGQKAWIGTRDGKLERITLRLGDRRSGISLELPPGAATETEARLKELIRAQGWDPGTPRRTKTDHGPVYTFRPPRMTSTPSWNQIELRLELDPLVKGLEGLGGKPRLLAVRTPESLEWSGSPAPDAAGVFKGERFAFYTLKPSGNDPFVLKGGVNHRRLLALLTSFAIWLLFPLLAAIAGRFYAQPQPEALESDKRWKKAERALCWVTAVGAFATLACQSDLLRLAPLLIPRLPSVLTTISTLPIPFAFIYFYWAQTAWRVAGPAAPPFKSMAMLKNLGLGLLFLVVFSAPLVTVGTSDPFQLINRAMGLFFIVIGGTLLFSWVTIRRKSKEAADKAQSIRPIPESDDDRRAWLVETAKTAKTPEEVAATEAALTKATPDQRRHLEALLALTPEEASWLKLAELLAREKKGDPAARALRIMPINGAVFVVGGIGVWFLPGIIGLLLMIAVSFGMVPLWKVSVNRVMAGFTKGGADAAVARLLDDPQRYVEVLRRLEEATATEKGTPPGDLYGTRRRALERSLRT